MTLLSQSTKLHHPLHRSIWDTVASTLSRTAAHLPAWSVTMLRTLLILGATLLVLAATRWWLRSRARKQPGLTYEIVPPDGSQWEPATWTTFYRALYGMSSPWWKRSRSASRGSRSSSSGLAAGSRRAADSRPGLRRCSERS